MSKEPSSRTCDLLRAFALTQSTVTLLAGGLTIQGRTHIGTALSRLHYTVGSLTLLSPCHGPVPKGP